MTKAVVSRLAIAVALAGGLGSTGVRAAEGETFKNLLGGMGLVPQEREPIRYRERAPLVLPPKLELRAPVAAEGFASANPSWPKDPDVVSRERRAAAERIPAGQSELYRLMDRNPLLTQQEMRAIGRTPNGGGTTDPASHVSDAARDKNSFFSSLFGGGGSEPAPAPVEDTTPVRRTLTDPPSVMRRSNGTNAVDRSANRRAEHVTEGNPFAFIVNSFGRRDDDD